MLFLCSVVLKNLCSYFSNTFVLAASQVAQVVRICLPIQETQEVQLQTLGWEGPLEEEMALQHSCLENSIGRGVWRAIVPGAPKSSHDWALQPKAAKLFLKWSSCGKTLYLKIKERTKDIEPLKIGGEAQWYKLTLLPKPPLVHLCRIHGSASQSWMTPLFVITYLWSQIINIFIILKIILNIIIFNAFQFFSRGSVGHLEIFSDILILIKYLLVNWFQFCPS